VNLATGRNFLNPSTSPTHTTNQRMYNHRVTTSDSRTGTFLLFAAGLSPSSAAAPVDPEAAFRFALILEAVGSCTGCAT